MQIKNKIHAVTILFNADISPPVYEAPKGFGKRHIQALILFISLTVGMMMRAQLSVSLVAMTSSPRHQNITCEHLSYTPEVTNLINSVEKNQSITKRVAETVCEDAQTLKPWTVYRVSLYSVKAIIRRRNYFFEVLSSRVWRKITSKCVTVGTICCIYTIQYHLILKVCRARFMNLFLY